MIAPGVSLTGEFHGLLGQCFTYITLRALQTYASEFSLLSSCFTIGQFWNVPFDVEDYVGDRGHLNPGYRAIVIMYRPGSNMSHQFVSLLESCVWDWTKQPCFYSGNQQGGPIGDIDSGPNDSVIEGRYTDYIVSSLVASDCEHCQMFDDARC